MVLPERRRGWSLTQAIRSSLTLPQHHFWSFLGFLVALTIITISNLSGNVVENSNDNLNDKSNPIQIWYGPVQHFGQLGKPQRWINVLGQFCPLEDDYLKDWEVTYWIDGHVPQKVVLGGDLHRLALPGDFNIQIKWDERLGRESVLYILAKRGTSSHRRQVKLIVERGYPWQLPYQVDFTSISSIMDLQKAVQIVDGKWELVGDNNNIAGVRTVERYYDRMITMGDDQWTDYETMVKLIVHDFTPPAPGPPTYYCTHVSVGMRWRGHHEDEFNPHRKYWPVGAFGEFMLSHDPTDNRTASGKWRIVFDGDYKRKPPLHASVTKHHALTLGEPIWLKTQVKTMPGGQSTRYSFKQWEALNRDGSVAKEPEEWDIVGHADMEGNYLSGALVLPMHNSDVTIQSVHVQPI